MTIHSCSYYCQRPECVARRVPLFEALYATPEDLGAQPTPATLAAMAMFRYLAWGWWAS